MDTHDASKTFPTNQFTLRYVYTEREKEKERPNSCIYNKKGRDGVQV